MHALPYPNHLWIQGGKMIRKKVGHMFLALVILSLLVPALAAVAAVPPEPTYTDDLEGPWRPIVDGLLNQDYPTDWPPLTPYPADWEWDVDAPYYIDPDNGDFFANLYLAGKLGNPILGKLYLRYNCGGGWLYALVLPNTDLGVTITELNQLDYHFIKVDGVKKVDANNSPQPLIAPNYYPDTPNFAWYDQVGDSAGGWEAVISLPEGSYALNVHTQVLYDGAPQTAQVEDRSIPLFIECAPPTAVELASFTGKAIYNGIQLDWETAMEINNLGFNLYRAESERGLQMQINSTLIPSKAPGSMTGAVYRFVDTDVKYRTTYYYWLESVDIYGRTTRYGPVVATYLPRLRPSMQPSIQPSFGR
jgi:hypothetical protein